MCPAVMNRVNFYKCKKTLKIVVYDNSDLKVYTYQEGETMCKHADNYVC